MSHMTMVYRYEIHWIVCRDIQASSFQEQITQVEAAVYADVAMYRAGDDDGAEERGQD